MGGNSGASTPTNGNVFGLFRPMGGGGGGTAPSSGQTTPASMLQPYSDVQPSPAPPPFTSHVTLGGGVVPGGTGGHPPHLLQLPKPNEGFAPGHPLVKDGRRHYGSKFTNVDRRFFVVSIQGRISIHSQALTSNRQIIPQKIFKGDVGTTICRRLLKKHYFEVLTCFHKS